MNRTSRFFAITISPEFRLVRPNFLLNMDMFQISRALNKCSKHWCLVPEFDKKSRLHYHGVIRIDDMVKWHRSVFFTLTKGTGFTCVKAMNTIKDHMGWLCYMYKDWHLTRAILNLEQPFMYSKSKRTRFTKVIEGKKTIFDYM